MSIRMRLALDSAFRFICFTSCRWKDIENICITNIIRRHILDAFNQILLLIVFRIFILSYMHIVHIFMDESFNDWYKYWIPYAVVLYIFYRYRVEAEHKLCAPPFYLHLSNILGKLQEITFSMQPWPAVGSTNRVAREMQKKALSRNKTNPVHASGRIKIPLVSSLSVDRYTRRYLNGGGYPPRSKLLCAFEHVMIAVSSSTQEEEQVFPFFMVLSACLKLTKTSIPRMLPRRKTRTRAGCNGRSDWQDVRRDVRFESRDNVTCASRKINMKEKKKRDDWSPSSPTNHTKRVQVT